MNLKICLLTAAALFAATGETAEKTAIRIGAMAPAR